MQHLSKNTRLELAILWMYAAFDIHRSACLAIHGECTDGLDTDWAESEVDAWLVNIHQRITNKVSNPGDFCYGYY